MALPAPTLLSASAYDVWTIDLSWYCGSTATPNDRTVIERKIGAGGWAAIATVNDQVTGTPAHYRDNSCIDGTGYTYRVYEQKWSIDDELWYDSDYSNEASAITPIRPPFNLEGMADSTTQITLRWNCFSQSETEFRIYNRGVLVTTSGPNTTTKTLAGLDAGTWYYFSITSYNAVAGESANSNECAIFTADPPSAPSLLTAVSKGTTKAQLNWRDNSDNETGFKVEQSPDGVGDWAQIATVAANITTYEVTGLTSNTPYWWRVRAYNDSGNSAYTNIANATTWAAIAQPTNLVTTPLTATDIELTWDDNSELEDWHCIERRSPTSPGTAYYYVDAYLGDDGNPGTITEPWKSIAKVNASTFSGGDLILFKRGETWREGLLIPSSGSAGEGYITFGAYGTGAKPLLLGSADRSATGDWTIDSGSIYKTTATITTADVGNLIFNNEASCGVKKKTKVECTAQGHFYFDPATNLIYLYSASNPGSYYTHIECGMKGIFTEDFPWALITLDGNSYVQIADLDLRYASWVGIQGYNTPSYVTVERCQLAYMGGANFDGEIQAGNGIEFYGSCSHITIRYNYLTEIFDDAITCQGSGSVITVSDIDIHHNITNKSTFGVSLWNQGLIGSSMNHIYVNNNTFMNCGDEVFYPYRWGYADDTACFKTYNAQNATYSDWIIKNNIFYRSIDYCVDFNYWLTDAQRNAMTFDHNLYYQDSGDGVLVHWHHPVDGEILYTADGTGTDRTFAEWKSEHYKDANSINDDPVFVSATDFTLQVTSPCIDVGEALGYLVDINGVTIPTGAGPDIGACEYGSGGGGGTVGDLFNESFEGVDNTIDEDSTDVTPPESFGTDVLKIEKANAANLAYVLHNHGSEVTTFYTRFRIQLASVTADSSQMVVQMTDAAWDGVWNFYVMDVSGQKKLRFLSYFDGDYHYVDADIAVDTWHDNKIEFNSTTKKIRWWLDDALLADWTYTAKGTGLGWQRMHLGDDGPSANTFLVYYDGIVIDSTGFPEGGTGEFEQIGTVAPNVTYYKDSGLAPDVYTYRVRAKQGAASYSAYSNESTATTLETPPAPADLRLDCELIADPGFEMWTTPTYPRDWVSYTEGTSSINRESAGPISGTYYLRIDGDGSGSKAHVLSSEFTLSPFKRYHLEFWAHVGTTGKTPVVYLYSDSPITALKTDGSWNYGAYSYCFQITEVPWRKYSLDFDGPGEEATFRLQFYSDPTYSILSSSLYVDKVRFYEVGSFDFRADEHVRLKWTASAGAVGYKIERSTDGSAFTEIAKIRTDVCSYRDIGRTKNTQYWYRVRAYNGAGNGAYCGEQAITTDTQYAPTRFETYIQRTGAELIYLFEVNPLMELKGWALVESGYTYELLLNERGIRFDYLYENGEALTEVTNVTAVEATAGTWYFDYYAQTIYVHPSGDDDPSNYLYTGSFWLYFCNWTKVTESLTESGIPYVLDKGTSFNGNYYYPFLSKAGIPDISQEIQPYYEGNFTVSSGSASLINAEINGEFFFDKRFKRYIWLGRKARILAGGPEFYYNEFYCINTGIISDISLNDRSITLGLRDYREGIHRTLPESKYTLTEFPGMDESLQDQIRPFGFGRIVTGMKCIDTANKIFEAHAGRIKTVNSLTNNGTALVEGTDFYVDYQRGRIVIERDLTFDPDSDVLAIDFDAACDDALDLIDNGAEVFKYILNNFLGLPDTELDLDSIWETRDARTDDLSLYLFSERSSDEIIKLIEHTIRAYSYQDSKGRLGIRIPQTTAPSDIKYLASEQIFDFGTGKNMESIYGEVMVHHSEDPMTNRYGWIMKTVNPAMWKYGCKKRLEIYTCLGSAADAEDLGDAIIALLDKEQIAFTVPRTLYTCYPGDLIYLTRNRFYSMSGTANNQLLRIISISKQIAGNRTYIKAEIV